MKQPTTTVDQADSLTDQKIPPDPVRQALASLKSETSKGSEIFRLGFNAGIDVALASLGPGPAPQVVTDEQIMATFRLHISDMQGEAPLGAFSFVVNKNELIAGSRALLSCVTENPDPQKIISTYNMPNS